MLLSGRRWDDAVEPQIFDDLAVVIHDVPNRSCRKTKKLAAYVSWSFHGFNPEPCVIV